VSTTQIHGVLSKTGAKLKGCGVVWGEELTGSAGESKKKDWRGVIIDSVDETLKKEEKRRKEIGRSRGGSYGKPKSGEMTSCLAMARGLLEKVCSDAGEGGEG